MQQVVATIPALHCGPTVTRDECPYAAAEVVKLHQSQVRTLIESQQGRFLSVVFRKLDGKLRKLTGRLGVTAHLAGGYNNVERSDRPYITVFDAKLQAYRTVNLHTVSALRAGGLTFEVVS